MLKLAPVLSIRIALKGPGSAHGGGLAMLSEYSKLVANLTIVQLHTNCMAVWWSIQLAASGPGFYPPRTKVRRNAVPAL